MSNKSIYVEAKTIELALIKAKAELGVQQKDIDYRVLKKTGGIASLFSGRKVELEVWQLQAGETRASEVDTQSLVEELCLYCRDLCLHLCGHTVEVSSRLDDKRLVLNIEDEYLLSAASKNSKLIEAFEHLLRKKPRHLRRSLPFRIFVDINKYRINKENELIDMAKDLASKVVTSQKPIVMNSMASQDRRIVHVALNNDQRIYTKSIGNGFERKLMILPTKSEPTASSSVQV